MLVPLVVVAVIGTIIFLIVYFTVMAPAAVSNVNKWQPNRTLHSFNSCGNSKTIALTFDDGPHEVGTVNLINDLGRLGVKGTFYLSPAVDATPSQAQCDLVKKLYDAGHSVQSHSYDHTDFITKSGQDVYNNLKTNYEWIKKCSGRSNIDLSFFRPPFGSLDPEYALFISKLGYTLGSWNVESLDYSGGNAQAVVNNVMANFANVGQGQSVVTIMHDKHYISGGALGSLDQIVPFFKNMGYTFVTGPQCYQQCQQDVCTGQSKIWPGTWAAIY
jgi:peptidoglycan/xylan/chitin deacetylase (PgdA/CDA1 family)